MPEIVGDESVGIKYAINGLLSVTPGRPAAARRDARGARPVERRGGLDQGGPRRRQDRRRADARRRLGDRGARLRHRPHARPAALARARPRPRRRGLQQDVRDRPSRRAVGVRPRRPAARRSRRASASSAPSSSRSPAGSGPHWYALQRALLEEYGERVTRREAEWESRWWSPIINAEHLALRDRAAMIDLSAFAIFDITGPGGARRRPAARAAPDGRRRRARRLHAAADAARRLPLGPHDHAARDEQCFRVVTGAAHGRSDRKWFADHLPGGRLGAAARPDLRRGARSASGARGRATSSRRVTGDDVSHEGFPFARARTIEIDSLRGARVADLLRRRPRLGALRAVRAGRARCGTSIAEAGAPHGDRRRPGSASTARPAGSRSATAPTASSSTASTTSSRPGCRARRVKEQDVRRPRGAPAPPRGGAGRDPLHADRRRPHLGERRPPLHARRRADPDARRRRRSSTAAGAARSSPAPAPARRSASTS